MSVRSVHRAALEGLPLAAWGGYLDAHSALPGPRANLELLEVAGQLAPAELLRAWAVDPDEYRACVGTAGLGRLAAEGDPTAPAELRAAASDGRWRVREAVAMALQVLGDADPTALRAVADDWATGTPLEQRAAIAGVCEPRLLRTPEAARYAVDLCARVTASLADLPAARRRAPDTRVLRQALGYCWSVAAVADPGPGFRALTHLAEGLRIGDGADDVRWILRENLRKARLARADAAATERLAALVAGT